MAVILKVLLINLLAALNFSNVFLNKKRLENKKREKNVFTSTQMTTTYAARYDLSPVRQTNKSVCSAYYGGCERDTARICC